MSRQFLQPADQLLDEHFDRRAAEDRAGLARRAVRTARARGRHRRPGRLEHADAPPGTRPGGRRQRCAHDRAGRAAAAGWAARSGSVTVPRAIARAGDRVTGVVTDGGERLTRAHRGRRLPRPHHPRAARRRDAAGARDPAVRVGNGIGLVVRLGTTGLPRYPVGGRLVGVQRDAAAGPQPRPPAGGARRVRRRPAADRAGRARHDAERAGPDDRSGRPPQRDASGRSGTPTRCRPASTGTTSPTARPTSVLAQRRAGGARASPARSSTGTCRRRSTWSASWDCCAAT